MHRRLCAHGQNSTCALSNAWSLCLVNHLHLLFIHPATVHFDCGEGAVDLTKILGGLLNIISSQLFVQVIDVLRVPGIGTMERLSRKQPGQGQLRRRGIHLPSKLFD